MSSEFSLQPVEYEPSLDAEGKRYVDIVPPKQLLSRGIKCKCSGTLFTTRQGLSLHFTTISHQNWLEYQNRNKNNDYMEVIKLRELVKQQQILLSEKDNALIELTQLREQLKQQQILLAEKDQEISEKNIAIHELSSMMHNYHNKDTTIHVLSSMVYNYFNNSPKDTNTNMEDIDM